MYLEKLKLFNFRNYKGSTELTFDNMLNVFLGNNAQGKSNLLEAIYYLSMTQSYRTFKDSNIVNFDADGFRLDGRAVSEEEPISVSVVYKQEGKKKYAYLNGIKCKNLSDLVGKIKVVVFAPEYLYLVKGSPDIRRKYIDNQIAQIDTKYFFYLRQYQNILEQRNSALKNEHLSESLDVWDHYLCSFGARITKIRSRVILKIKAIIRETFQEVSGSDSLLDIDYSSSLMETGETVDEKEIADAFQEKLKGNRRHERITGYTANGPHRDDLIFFLNGKPLKEFGSQGQQRMAVVALKLGELNFIKAHTNKNPLFLLDDVMSELDAYRRQFLLHVLKNTQTFITATDESQIDKSVFKNAAVRRVNEGKIE